MKLVLLEQVIIEARAIKRKAATLPPSAERDDIMELSGEILSRVQAVLEKLVNEGEIMTQ